jgi:hypothetical protein
MEGRVFANAPLTALSYTHFDVGLLERLIVMADSKNAAIVVVPSDWTPEHAVGLSEETHQRYFDMLRSGSRVLIYKSAPVDAIVAEGEVIDQMMVRLDEWPATNVHERPHTGVGTRADYVLPLRILYSRASFDYISLPVVQEWVNDPDFPHVEWLPIDEDAYGELTNWP